MLCVQEVYITNPTPDPVPQLLYFNVLLATSIVSPPAHSRPQPTSGDGDETTRRRDKSEHRSSYIFGGLGWREQDTVSNALDSYFNIMNVFQFYILCIS